MLFENPILGWLRDDIFMFFSFFWVSVGNVFCCFLDTVLASIFRGSPGLCQSQSSPGGGGDLRGIWGPKNKSTEAKQLTRSANE